MPFEMRKPAVIYRYRPWLWSLKRKAILFPPQLFLPIEVEQLVGVRVGSKSFLSITKLSIFRLILTLPIPQFKTSTNVEQDENYVQTSNQLSSAFHRKTTKIACYNANSP